MIKLLLFITTTIAVNITMAQSQVKTIEQLTTDTSGFALVKEWAKNSKNKVEFLLVEKTKACETLYNLQVTTRSPMGAITYFTGGILIDNGWIRILGSGSEKLKRTIVSWNKGKTFSQIGEQPKYLLVADDILGGLFAINGGAIGTDLGKIYYFAPDSLTWDALNLTYSDFLAFCFNGKIEAFYKSFRWKGWEKDILNIKGDQAFSFIPFLWSKEGKDLNKVSKKPVPIDEVYTLNTDFQKSITR
jgi:hypothetical protein